MKGLKIIPMFLLLILCSYAGMLFVEQNRDQVIISFARMHSRPIALGFVVLTSALAGMLVCGALCSLELFVLYLQNKNLRRRLSLTAGPRTPVQKDARRETKLPVAATATPSDRTEAN